MPTYDFRCRLCADRREVPATYAVASGLQLVCTACGGIMEKAFTASIQVMTSSAAPPPSGPARRRRRRGRDSCDAAVDLTRPNPFAAELPRGAQEVLDRE